MTAKNPMDQAAQRWAGSDHSAADAITAATKFLRGHHPIEAEVSLGELIAICSELVFRTTGERIRPAWNTSDMAAKMMAMEWVRVEDGLPDHCDEVLVKLSGGYVCSAAYSTENGWTSMWQCGAHPGYEVDWTQGGKESIAEVEQWIDTGGF